MSVYETLPASVVLALAIQEIAGKLHTIEHLNVTPDVLQTNQVKKRPTCSYDISTMSGTATADTTIAALNNIITSLNRQGKRLVQCFVFSNMDIAIFRTMTYAPLKSNDVPNTWRHPGNRIPVNAGKRKLY